MENPRATNAPPHPDHAKPASAAQDKKQEKLAQALRRNLARRKHATTAREAD